MRILVYGTLRKGQGAYRSFGLEASTDYVDNVRIEGSMYDLGSFPGIKLDGNPDGFLCDVLDLKDPDDIQHLDAYEGYVENNPASSLYLRQTVELPHFGKCFIYEYNNHVGGKPRIASGDWAERSRR